MRMTFPRRGLTLTGLVALGLALTGPAALADDQHPPPTPGTAMPTQSSPADAAKASNNASTTAPEGAADPAHAQLNPVGRTSEGARQIEEANGNEPEIPPPVDWSFTGILGHYDTAQLQRGYQVYKEVCSNCHSMKLVAFRNLGDIGYSAGQVKALAATYQIEDGPNDQGEMYKRPGRPSDYFPSPFPNAQAAAAAYGKQPPDMSDLAKARSWERGFPLFVVDFFTQTEEAEGPTYIHAVLNGYTKEDDPKYNIYMPNHKIAMPKPLSDGQVAYTDGSPQTLDQYSKDVSAFLMWAAEPKLEERKSMGLRAMIFLIVFATLLYFVKRRISARVGRDVVVGGH